MKREKVLIYAFDMLPYTFSFGGCQRMYFLMENLMNDYDFHVVHSMHTTKINDCGKKIFFQSHPIAFPSIFQKMLGTVVASDNEDQNNNNNKPSMIKKIIGRCLTMTSKIIEKILFNEIITGMGILGKIFFEKSKKTILKVVDENQIKKVIISSPPFVIYQAIAWLKKMRPDVQVIMDYRDPWNLWNNKKIGIPVLKEKKYLKLARYITVFSQQYKDDLIKKYSIPEKKVHVVMNGFSGTSWKEIENTPVKKASEDKIVISYVGTISFNKTSFRDPSIFLEAFENFKYRDRLLLRFIGVDLKDSHLLKIKERLKDSIEFIGRVKQTDSLIELLRSDALVLFHTHNDESNKYIFNGKFFDYLKSEKFLIGIGDEKVLFNQMILNLQLGLTSENKKERIMELLEKIIDLKNKNDLNPKKQEQINQYSREFQNIQFKELLKSI